MAKSHTNVFLVTGDLGFGILTDFESSFPERFLNAGISEQNMTSVAAGIALEGNIVFTYSIGNFPTLRCLEQIRNDCAYHKANVKVIAVGGGFSYGALGMSHHATEDLAILRALPEIAVFAPGDLTEAEMVMNLAIEHEGTCYLRIGKGGERRIHNKNLTFSVGEALQLSSGGEIAIFSTGTILEESLLLIELLKKAGIQSSLYSFPTIKPIDHLLISTLSSQVRLIVTIEEHNIFGGFGSAVAEVLAEIYAPYKAALLRIGIPDIYSSEVGDQQYLRNFYGLSASKMLQKILHCLEK